MLLLTTAPTPSRWGLAKNFLVTRRGSFMFSAILWNWWKRKDHGRLNEVYVYIGRWEKERERSNIGKTQVFAWVQGSLYLFIPILFLSIYVSITQSWCVY